MKGINLVLERACYCINRRMLLKELDETIRLERLVVVLGANGAGKSLFMRLCHGLIKPRKGYLSWHDSGTEERIIPPRQTMVFQTPVMLRRTALDNVAYVLKSSSREKVNEHAMAALEWAGLEKLAFRPAHQLSLGEQQLLAIARAWATQPTVLFLDEPTASLDPSACQRVEQLILAMQNRGVHIMMTTHNLGQAKRMAEQIIYLHEGRILEYRSADEFFTQPSCREAREFIQWESMERGKCKVLRVG